ncbi:MAG TPA: AI-2E family transporter [Steroidobacteraceae bacterium]|nr:AI-2E family transporter [Steroidobacteraceae bacterium]
MNGSGQASRTTRSALLSVVVVVAVLKLAQEVFVPLAIAILLTFLLAPLVERLTRWSVNRVLATLVALSVALTLAGALGNLVFTQVADLAHQLPNYQRQLRSNLTELGGALRVGVLETTRAVEQLTEEIDRVSPPQKQGRAVPKVQVIEPTPTALETLRDLVGPLIRPVGTTLAVVVLVAFMLLRLPDLRERIIRLLGSRNLNITTEALNDAANRVSSYLVMQVLINGWTGFWVTLGLWALHVPNAGLWGVLTVLLRFIPYVGAWAAAAMPVALSFAVFDDWTQPVLVAALFAGLEFFAYSVLEPWLYGAHTGVSPVALLLAAAFWTWLWGLPGLFLAIPLTVCVVVMGKYIPALAFLEVLLGDEPVLEPHERLYQRLLSSNRDEADAILQDALRLNPMLDVCDALIVPAMMLMEEDYHRGSLAGEKRDTILEHVSQWVDEQLDGLEPAAHADAMPANKSTASVTVACIPAADRADEIIVKLLEVVLMQRGLSVRILGPTEAGGRWRADTGSIEVIVISALPPEAVAPARMLSKRVRGGNPKIRVIVGLWRAAGDLERARQRLESAGATQLVTNFAACLAALEPAGPEQSSLQAMPMEPVASPPRQSAAEAIRREDVVTPP